jgi:hypothetical protein
MEYAVGSNYTIKSTIKVNRAWSRKRFKAIASKLFDSNFIQESRFPSYMYFSDFYVIYRRFMQPF